MICPTEHVLQARGLLWERPTHDTGDMAINFGFDTHFFFC